MIFPVPSLPHPLNPFVQTQVWELIGFFSSPKETLALLLGIRRQSDVVQVLPLTSSQGALDASQSLVRMKPRRYAMHLGSGRGLVPIHPGLLRGLSLVFGRCGHQHP